MQSKVVSVRLKDGTLLLKLRGGRGTVKHKSKKDYDRKKSKDLTELGA